MYYDMLSDFKKQNPNLSKHSPETNDILEHVRQKMIQDIEHAKKLSESQALGDKINNAWNIVFKNQFPKDYFRDVFIESYGDDAGTIFFSKPR